MEPVQAEWREDPTRCVRVHTWCRQAETWPSHETFQGKWTHTKTTWEQKENAPQCPDLRLSEECLGFHHKLHQNPWHPASRSKPWLPQLISWCFDFEPSQPQRTTSGLNTNFPVYPSYSFHKASYYKSHFFSLCIFHRHSTREPASSRVTYFILWAYTGTGVSHSQHTKKNWKRFWKKCRWMDQHRDDLKLLPCSSTKPAVYGDYSAACAADGISWVSQHIFLYSWKRQLPDFLLMKLKTDVWWTCQKNNKCG